jgi:hypothetical protein
VPQKNFIKIPSGVLAKISKIDIDDVVVACVKTLKPEDFARYAHLGLKVENGVPVYPPPRVPPPRIGRYSYANVYGREKVRRDLPKVEKTRSWSSPHFGDWSKGSHTHSKLLQVYQRQFFPPKQVTLTVELLQPEADGAGFTIKFAVDQVIRRSAPDFHDDLLYNLNILQENVLSVNVFPSTATLEEYVNTVRVEWQILPPGNLQEIVRRMLQGKREISAEQQQVMVARLTAMEGLNPECYIAGSDEFLRYFGAKFEDDFVAFENPVYGNALYVMFQDWKTLCQLSRIDLLKGPREGFERIPHHGGWAHRLGALLAVRRGTAAA